MILIYPRSQSYNSLYFAGKKQVEDIKKETTRIRATVYYCLRIFSHWGFLILKPEDIRFKFLLYPLKLGEKAVVLTSLQTSEYPVDLLAYFPTCKIVADLIALTSWILRRCCANGRGDIWALHCTGRAMFGGDQRW